jgi:ABC-2 type transport system ATP-binding protein
VTTTKPSIQAIRLSKWYGKVTALQDVTLQLKPGVWGLLGPNGSGKTTFMRLVTGLTRPSLGEVRVCGESPFANPSVLRRVGLCPEADALFDELTGLEFVASMAELSGYSRQDARDRAAKALKDFGLDKAMDRRMGGYSRGMRQRAKLAQSVVHEPDVLLLDEPLTGTDPTSRQVILDQVRIRAAEGAVVLFSTHVLHEVESITEQVLLIARGQVVAQGKVHEIRDLLHEHPHHVRVDCDAPRKLAAAVIGSETGVLGVSFPTSSEVEFETKDPDRTYSAIAKTIVEGGYTLRSLTSPDATLEALFHYLVERSGRMAGTGADAPSGGAKPVGYQQQLEAGAAPKKKKKKDKKDEDEPAAASPSGDGT